jgi:hypothetical protein
MGAFQGALASFSATDLGAFAIRAALERSGLAPGDVDEVLLGNVCSANLGQVCLYVGGHAREGKELPALARQERPGPAEHTALNRPTLRHPALPSTGPCHPGCAQSGHSQQRAVHAREQGVRQRHEGGGAGSTDHPGRQVLGVVLGWLAGVGCVEAPHHALSRLAQSPDT